MHRILKNRPVFILTREINMNSMNSVEIQGYDLNETSWTKKGKNDSKKEKKLVHVQNI